MAHPITTSGLDSGTISTEHQSGQTIGEWVGAHCETLDAGTPTGDILSTEWTSASGPEKTVTNRRPGESDGAFSSRHKAQFVIAMVDAPPIA